MKSQMNACLLLANFKRDYIASIKGKHSKQAQVTNEHL
jgi:hypothetical protein